MRYVRRPSVVVSVLSVAVAAPAAGQVHEVIDRAAAFVYAAGGFDPSDTGVRHSAFGAEFDFQIVARLRPHIEYTRWHYGIDTPTCGALQQCDPTVSEFGGGIDVMLLTASKLDLFTGPAVGYIRDGSDGRWTWSGRVSATALPKGTFSPRIEIAYWKDPDTGRQAVLGRIGVQINLTGGGSVGTTAN
jgi:hypothetical protein